MRIRVSFSIPGAIRGSDASFRWILKRVALRNLVARGETKRLFRKLLGHLLSSVRRIDPIRRLPWEANMRLKDLIDLFVDDDDDNKVRRPDDEFVPRESRDTSSLADIVRILRELDGQHDTRR